MANLPLPEADPTVKDAVHDGRPQLGLSIGSELRLFANLCRHNPVLLSAGVLPHAFSTCYHCKTALDPAVIEVPLCQVMDPRVNSRIKSGTRVTWDGDRRHRNAL